jgi:hypothetical protein
MSLRVTAVAIASLMLPLLANGCSSAPDAPVMSTEQAAKYCPPDSDCGGGGGGAPPKPPSLASVTTSTCGGDDRCGAYGVPPPSELRELGCSYGVGTDFGYVFACPSWVSIPGQVSIRVSARCSGGTVSTSYSACDNCFGAPANNWVLALVDMSVLTCFDPLICNGGCPLPLPS